MSEQLKNCKVCNESIAKNAKTCPHCGAKNKTPLLKKWWIWAVIAFIALAGIFGSSSEETVPTDNVTPETSATQEEQNDTAENTEEIQDTENKVADAYISISQTASTTFNVNEKAKAFMKDHSNYFPGSSDIQGAISDLVDSEITYAHLSKNINKYGDKLISVSGDVVDIIESDDGTITYLHLSDYEGNNFIVYYLGSLNNVFDGGYTWGYVLPLDKISFENMGGSYTEAIVCAGCYIDDTEEVN